MQVPWFGETKGRTIRSLDNLEQGYFSDSLSVATRRLSGRATTMTTAAAPGRPISSRRPSRAGRNLAKLTAADGATDDYSAFALQSTARRRLSGRTATTTTATGLARRTFSRIPVRAGFRWPSVSPDDGQATDYFGISVSISGSMAVVGAYRDDDCGTDSGSVYVFQNVGSRWTQVAKLTAGDGRDGRLLRLWRRDQRQQGDCRSGRR